jgi:tRNA-dihydrouridine synthase A
MADPGRVRELISVMRQATQQPVTVKHRIGIDGRESYEELCEFVNTVEESRPARFTVHARIAILSGLSPKENRMVPPLRYEDVYRLKRQFPDLQIEINGHIKSIAEIRSQLDRVDAVMVGRAAYDDPWLFHAVDPEFFGVPSPVRSRGEVIEAVIPYMERWAAAGWSERSILRHMLGLFPGVPGSRKYRQILSGPLHHGAGSEALREAVSHLPEHVLSVEQSSVEA